MINFWKTTRGYSKIITVSSNIFFPLFIEKLLSLSEASNLQNAKNIFPFLSFHATPLHTLNQMSDLLRVGMLACDENHSKYTNPARGIIYFCKQKFYRPLICSPWTLHFLCTPCYEVRTLRNTHRALRNTPRALHNTPRTLRNAPRVRNVTSTLRNAPRPLRNTPRTFSNTPS